MPIATGNAKINRLVKVMRDLSQAQSETEINKIFRYIVEAFDVNAEDVAKVTGIMLMSAYYALGAEAGAGFFHVDFEAELTGLPNVTPGTLATVRYPTGDVPDRLVAVMHTDGTWYFLDTL